MGVKEKARKRGGVGTFSHILVYYLMTACRKRETRRGTDVDGEGINGG